jgi:predicted phage baseplate assembly protein
VTTTLDTCGCEPRPEAQPEIRNRPGLEQLGYRIGTHPTFLQRLLRRIAPTGAGSDLEQLTTRQLDDPAIGVLDAFAAVADVLTFYQERIANEGYLRTATERRSLLELARMIGYELAPGVAASTYLQFGVESRTAPVAVVDPTQVPPATARVPQSTQVKSLPAQGQLPQTFETSGELVARGDWNELRPLLARPKQLDSAEKQLYLAGTSVQIEVGGTVLLYDGSKQPAVKRVFQVEREPAHDRTRVDFEDAPPKIQPPLKPFFLPAILTLKRLALNEDVVQDRIINKTWSDEGLHAFVSIQRWRPAHILKFALNPPAPPPTLPSAKPGVYVFRERAASFGNNAPVWQALPEALTTGTNAPYQSNWDATATEPNVFQNSQVHELTPSNTVLLDTVYPKVRTDSWVVLMNDSGLASATPLRVGSVSQKSPADYAISGRVTAVVLETLDGHAPTNKSDFKVRKTSILAQSERLDLAPVPLSDTIAQGTTTLELDRIVLDWPTGQPLAFTGERDDLPGVVVTDVVHLVAATHAGGTTTLEFEPLGYGFVRKTLTISANVVAATHGETVQDEVLGSSNGSANQRFTLRKAPVTYVSASVPGGARSSLEVRVDGILWHETRSLYGLGPTDRRYVVQRDDDGVAHVVFGDGVQGARPASGTENVRASYRQGIGRPGLLEERKLTLLQTRPLGIRDVVNPVAATGAEDPEPRSLARQNAPLTVLALDRVVSLTDYEDFARAFASVGKASATALWRGDAELVHVTVAGPDAAEIPTGSDTYDNLVAAIESSHDPGRAFRVASFTPVYFDVLADVLVDPSYEPATVVAAVKARLADEFSFARRAFGQGVSEAEVIATILSVPGALDTRVSGLAPVVGGTPSATPTKQDPLLANLARWSASETGEVDPAELLLLSPAGATITERTQ